MRALSCCACLCSSLALTIFQIASALHVGCDCAAFVALLIFDVFRDTGIPRPRR